MQALKVSRAVLLNGSNGKSLLEKEILEFDHRLGKVFAGGVANTRDVPEVKEQFEKIEVLWDEFKKAPDGWDIEAFENFVSVIDGLVTLLQRESEKKLALLRLIQGLSLFLVLLVSVVVLFRLHKVIVIPLKQIVEVAKRAGKGDFELKADYEGTDELGVLASTINQMSQELKLKYQDYEKRVAQKTRELIQSNRSLELLYRAARKLTTRDLAQSEKKIVEELESMLGQGSLSIIHAESMEEFIDEDRISSPHSRLEKIDPVGSSHVSFRKVTFKLEKEAQLFGALVWQLPQDETPEHWQTQLIQAMADLLATAIELDQRRNAENRLILAEERAVIARELHDSLAQSLSYLKVQLSLLTRKVEKDAGAEQVSETIEDIRQGLNNAYSQLRELLTTFRLKLDDPSIENALQGTVAEFSAKCHHPVNLKFHLPNNVLSANQEVHVLQIVREALSNVQRHARASEAGVLLTHKDDVVCVKIWDDGKGIDISSGGQGHLGLGIMEERAKSLDALIEIKKREPEGTLVQVEFKVEPSS